jgi:hypothetical protein
VVTVEEVRSFALTLPRTTEAIVRGELKLRAGRVAYVSFSSNEALMRFAFPKEWRDALVDAEPDKYVAPDDCQRRYNRALVRLAAIDAAEMRELVLDAWALVVPKRIAEAYAENEASADEETRWA